MSTTFPLILKNSKLIHILLISLLLITTMVLYGSFFEYFLNTNILGGYDITGHFSINDYYYQHIFPKSYGWIPNYYAGIPFPLFYPPLFYFLTSSFSFLLDLELFLIFKYILVILFLMLPLVLYRVSFMLTNSKTASFLNGIIVILFLGFSHNFGGELGLSITSTLNSGLVTQLLGGVLFFIWLPGFIKNKKKIRKNLISIIFFSLLLLSNVHIIQVGLLSVLIIFIYDLFTSKRKFKKIFLHYLKYLLISLSLVSFWYIPLIKYYDFSTTKIVSNNFLENYPLWFLLFLLFFVLIGYIFSYKNKVKGIQKIIIIIVTLLFILFLVPFIFSGLPIQPYRSLPIIFLLSSIVLSYATISLININVLKKYLKYIIYISVFIPFVIAFKHPPIDVGSYPKHNINDLENIAEYIKDKKDGRSMVEVYTSQDPKTLKMIPEHYVLSGLIGLGSHQTIWTVFRESTLSSFFVQALRNSFSFGHESFGIRCFLCEKKSIKELRDNDIETKIKRAELFNLKYFIIHNGVQYDYFSQYSDYFDKVLSTSTWNIFKLNSKTNYARILDYQPHLVFTKKRTKNRKETGIDSFDWIRINEEWFKYADFNNIFVKNNNTIDEHQDLDLFSTIILIDYNYSSLEKAYSKLEKYSNGKNALVLFPSDDPLYIELLKLNRGNIIPLELTNSPQKDIPNIINIINKYKKTNNNKLDLKNVDITHKDIKLTIPNPDKELLPIQISSSYFPTWKIKGGNTVYLSSPNFIFIFSDKKDITIYFEEEKNYTISIIGLLILLYLLIQNICNLRNIVLVSKNDKKTLS